MIELIIGIFVGCAIWFTIAVLRAPEGIEVPGIGYIEKPKDGR